MNAVQRGQVSVERLPTALQRSPQLSALPVLKVPRPRPRPVPAPVPVLLPLSVCLSLPLSQPLPLPFCLPLSLSQPPAHQRTAGGTPGSRGSRRPDLVAADWSLADCLVPVERAGLAHTPTARTPSMRGTPRTTPRGQLPGHSVGVRGPVDPVGGTLVEEGSDWEGDEDDADSAVFDELVGSCWALGVG